MPITVWTTLDTNMKQADQAKVASPALSVIKETATIVNIGQIYPKIAPSN